MSETPKCPTPPPLPTADHIPSDLVRQPRFTAWKPVLDKEKWRKPPHSPVSGERVGPVEKNAEHFLPFEEAVAGAKRHNLDGVGLVLFKDDGLVFIDIDDGIKDGVVDPEVKTWLQWFPNTWVHESPSGTGYHIIGRGKISKALQATPLSRTSTATVEIYGWDRYATLTDKLLPGTLAVTGDIQLGINKLMSHLQVATPSAPSSVSITERPWSIFSARKKHANNLEVLRQAKMGEGNKILNDVALFAARAFKAGALEEDEATTKRQMLDIVTKKWEHPHDEPGARATIVSGWNCDKATPLTLVDWKQKFHTGAELETGDVKLYINGILPEGVTAIGSLSAVGKTWLALAMVRALTTGTKFLGVFDVPEAVPVLYLVPEMGSRALRKRLERLHIPMNDRFYCQTVSDGVCALNDPNLEAAVVELNPIVFLDTAVRFNPSNDENSASQNAALLASDLFRLVRWGARAVVCLHHSPKYSGEAEFMTLENVLRGTGDLGAMCDAVWGLQHDKRKADNGKDWDYEYLEESQQLTRLYVRCVKPRDFDAVSAFRVQGRPYIDEKGDFVVLADADTPELKNQILSAIEKNPKLSVRELMDKFHIGHGRLMKLTRNDGWKQNKKGWNRQATGSEGETQENIPF